MAAPEEFPSSPSLEEQPLLPLRFPKKLWKIVNECKSGAIAWSEDGTEVVIDYSKFKSHYLDSPSDIFKTSNISSFIRQLNLYGFRKISPRHRVTVGSRPDLHVFRNDSFVRGRPDMLQAVIRRKGVLRAKMNQEDDGGGAGPSSGGQSQCHVPVHGARVLHNQGNGIATINGQGAVARAVEVQPVHPERLPSRPTVVAPSAVGASSDTSACEYNASAYWDSMFSTSEDSTSGTETSDEEDGHSVAKDQFASAGSSASMLVGGGVADCEASDRFVDDLIQRTMASCESPSQSCADEMAALLDPNQPPMMFHEAEEERNLIPPIEEFLMVDPSIRPVGESEEDDVSLISL